MLILVLISRIECEVPKGQCHSIFSAARIFHGDWQFRPGHASGSGLQGRSLFWATESESGVARFPAHAMHLCFQWTSIVCDLRQVFHRDIQSLKNDLNGAKIVEIEILHQNLLVGKEVALSSFLDFPPLKVCACGLYPCVSTWYLNHS